MNIHKHSAVNALVNPVAPGDIVISESGERYSVMQNMCGEYWLRHTASGVDLTRPVYGQIGIVGQIDALANI